MLSSPINTIYYFLGPYASIFFFPWINIFNSLSLDTVVRLYKNMFLGSFFEVAANKVAFNCSRFMFVLAFIWPMSEQDYLAGWKSRHRILHTSWNIYIFANTVWCHTFSSQYIQLKKCRVHKDFFLTCSEVEWLWHYFILHCILFKFPRSLCLSEWDSRLQREMREASQGNLLLAASHSSTLYKPNLCHCFNQN